MACKRRCSAFVETLPTQPGPPPIRTVAAHPAPGGTLAIAKAGSGRVARLVRLAARGTRDAAGRGRPARSLPAALDRYRRVKGRARRSRAPWVALDPAAAKDNDQQQPGGRNVRGCVGAHHARDGERKDGRGSGGRQRWIGFGRPGWKSASGATAPVQGVKALKASQKGARLRGSGRCHFVGQRLSSGYEKG